MPTWDVCVLTGSYSNDDENKGVIVELYGKTRENESISVRVHGFRPYFHLVEPPQSIINELKEDPEVLDLEDVELSVNNVPKKCLKVTIIYPYKVPNYRQKYREICDVLAADIPFIHRFYYDKDLGPYLRFTGQELVNKPKGKFAESENIKKYTTELVVDAESYESCDPFKPSLKILSFDIENSIKHKNIYSICCAVRDDGELVYKSFADEEDKMITDFLEYVRRTDPDVITGYNIDGYDIPVIMERAAVHRLGDLNIGRDLKPPQKVMNRFWRLHGRIIADAWWHAKKELRPKKESLNNIAKLVLNEQKHDVDPSKIDEEWANDREKVIKYCSKDAELALRILEKIEVLEKAMDLATVSKLTITDVMNSGASTLIDSILIREADRANIGVPLTHHTTKSKKIEGGYVHSVQSGLYHWLCVLDFRAMYPSIIIANNICFTTLDPDGATKSPVEGVAYLSPDQKSGLLPKILERLMADRDEAKQKMANAKDEDEFKYYNGVQDAIKILMNSVYGVFASAFYRFTDPKIGESITAFGRKNIKDIIEKLESENIPVIYSDTDSIFIQSPHTELDPNIEFGKKIADRFSVGGGILEFEKILESFFTHGKKKRYVGNVVYPEKKQVVRGYEIRRTDAFDLQSEALTQIFDSILSGEDIDTVVKYARGVIADIKDGKVPLEKLVISKTVKEIGYYKDPDKMANVQAMRKRVKLGYEYVTGMKVSWIVVNSNITPQEVEPYVDGREFEFKPDWNYYARRTAMSLARVTDVFGWDEKELLTGVQQKSLFSDFEDKGGSKSTEPVPPSQKPVKKKPKKEYTLTDFM
jgi:DNA polymerase I